MKRYTKEQVKATIAAAKKDFLEIKKASIRATKCMKALSSLDGQIPALACKILRATERQCFDSKLAAVASLAWLADARRIITRAEKSEKKRAKRNGKQ